MSALMNDVDASITALLLAGAMLAAWAAGRYRGRALGKEAQQASASKFHDAILALLGLLLAFTFSMALVKHDQRRQMVVADSNAIGDFSTCVSLLNEPVRGKLHAVVRRYLEHRLSLPRVYGDEAGILRKLDEAQELHNQMQALVKEAVDGGSPLVVPLVNTFNELTSSHAARLAAARDRLPASIVLLLFLAAVISMALMGWYQGVAHEWHPGATFAFTALVGMVVWVTLDLNQPQRGWITVSQEPLQRLLAGMGQE